MQNNNGSNILKRPSLIHQFQPFVLQHLTTCRKCEKEILGVVNCAHICHGCGNVYHTRCSKEIIQKKIDLVCIGPPKKKKVWKIALIPSLFKSLFSKYSSNVIVNYSQHLVNENTFTIEAIKIWIDLMRVENDKYIHITKYYDIFDNLKINEEVFNYLVNMVVESYINLPMINIEFPVDLYNSTQQNQYLNDQITMTEEQQQLQYQYQLDTFSPKSVFSALELSANSCVMNALDISTNPSAEDELGNTNNISNGLSASLDKLNNQHHNNNNQCKSNCKSTPSSRNNSTLSTSNMSNQTTATTTTTTTTSSSSASSTNLKKKQSTNNTSNNHTNKTTTNNNTNSPKLHPKPLSRKPTTILINKKKIKSPKNRSSKRYTLTEQHKWSSQMIGLSILYRLLFNEKNIIHFLNDRTMASLAVLYPIMINRLKNTSSTNPETINDYKLHSTNCKLLISILNRLFDFETLVPLFFTNKVIESISKVNCEREELVDKLSKDEFEIFDRVVLILGKYFHLEPYHSLIERRPEWIDMIINYSVTHKVGIIHHEIYPSEVQIIQEIYDSPLCTVYSAVYNGIDVAVKEFSQDGFAFDWPSFYKEITIVSASQHPKVIKCYGAHTKNTTKPFIVTELCSRGTISNALNQIKKSTGQPPSITLIIHMAIDASQALEYIHSKNIIHRDVKTANFLVNQNWEVKLIDFGVSRFMENRNGYTVIGTPNYMACELFNGQPYHQPADVFSFGVVLWEMFTQDVPYTNLTRIEQVQFVQSGGRPTIPSTVPLNIAALIESCWLQDPLSRPTFTEILGFFYGILNPKPDREHLVPVVTRLLNSSIIQLKVLKYLDTTTLLNCGLASRQLRYNLYNGITMEKKTFSSFWIKLLNWSKYKFRNEIIESSGKNDSTNSSPILCIHPFSPPSNNSPINNGHKHSNNIKSNNINSDNTPSLVIPFSNADNFNNLQLNQNDIELIEQKISDISSNSGGVGSSHHRNVRTGRSLNGSGGQNHHLLGNELNKSGGRSRSRSRSKSRSRSSSPHSNNLHDKSLMNLLSSSQTSENGENNTSINYDDNSDSNNNMEDNGADITSSSANSINKENKDTNAAGLFTTTTTTTTTTRTTTTTVYDGNTLNNLLFKINDGMPCSSDSSNSLSDPGSESEEYQPSFKKSSSIKSSLVPPISAISPILKSGGITPTNLLLSPIAGAGGVHNSNSCNFTSFENSSACD